MSGIVLTLLILFGAIILFVTELVPLGITPLLVLSSLAVLRILPVKDVLSGFSNSTTLLVLFMGPVGEALLRSGFSDLIGRKVIRTAGKSETRLVGFTMVVAALLSAFTSNTGTAIVMAPVVMAVAGESGLSASSLLLPLAYGASLGGMLTLVGTPPNIVVQGALREATGNSFGFFEFGKVSLPVVAASILYMMFIGRKQIKARLPVQSRPQAAFEGKRGKMVTSACVALLVIIGMVFEERLSVYGLTLPIIAMIGACLTVVTRCITMEEFTGSIEWTAILLMGGMQPLGLAMQKTGAADLLAAVFSRIVTNPSPVVLVGVVVLFAGTLAQFMSHTAATSVLAPVCVAIAYRLGVSPTPLLLALCHATSIAFATPIGTPPNVIVYHKGGYKFSDFTRTGLPLFLLGWLLLSFLIPRAYPL